MMTTALFPQTWGAHGKVFPWRQQFACKSDMCMQSTDTQVGREVEWEYSGKNE